MNFLYRRVPKLHFDNNILDSKASNFSQKHYLGTKEFYVEEAPNLLNFSINVFVGETPNYILTIRF